jgi:hypothetical protein
MNLTDEQLKAAEYCGVTAEEYVAGLDGEADTDLAAGNGPAPDPDPDDAALVAVDFAIMPAGMDRAEYARYWNEGARTFCESRRRR